MNPVNHSFMNMPLRRTMLALLLASALTGCQLLGPLFDRPASPLPTTFNDTVSEADPTSPMALQQWWTLLNDATLNRLEEKAVANNGDVQLAVARIEQADAQVRETAGNVLPTVTLDSNNTRNRITAAGANPVFGINPRNDFKLAFNASIELDVWGKLKTASAGARANLLATKYAKETVRWSLVSLVASHYLAVRSMDAQLSATKDNLKTAEESLSMTQQQSIAGVGSVLDVHQAELVVTNLRGQALELERLRGISEHQLGLLTNDFSVRIAPGSLMQLPIPPVPPAGLPSRLMEARPDVQQAEQQLVYANANLGLAKAALYPTFSLTGAFGGESLLLSDMLTSPARIFTVGFAASLPIFNGGRLNAKVDQASAIQKQAVITYQNTLRTAFTEVNDALVNGRRYREIEGVAQNRLNITANILKVSQNRYKAGYSSYLQVLDAQRNYNDAALTLVQNRQNTLAASVALFKALGGGWDAAALTQTPAKAK